MASRELVDTFKKYDTNGNGLIEETELHELLVGLGFPEEKVCSLFSCMDLNKNGGVDYDEFVHWLLNAGPDDRVRGVPIVIGISGCTRSGKSWLAKKLRDLVLGPTTPIVCQDAFWRRSVKVRSLDGREVMSEEDPACTDHTAFADAIRSAKANARGRYVIAEGFQLLHDKDILGLLDYIFHIELGREECIRRRSAKRGPLNPNPLDAGTCENVVWPTHERYIRDCVMPLGARVQRFSSPTSEEEVVSLVVAVCADLKSSRMVELRASPVVEATGPVTGIWQTDGAFTESGFYFVSELRSKVYWLGVGRSKQWAHVFVGERRGNAISGEWGDIPLGRDVYHGTLQLEVGPSSMSRTAQRGGFGCSHWKRIPRSREAMDAAFFPSKEAYWGDDYLTGIFDNDEVEHGATPGIYFMSQWKGTVFWFGRSKEGHQYANVGKGCVLDSELHLDWADIPLGSDSFAGNLVLSSNIVKETLVKKSDSSGIFGGMLWKKREMPHDKFATPGLVLRMGPCFRSMVKKDSDLSVLQDYECSGKPMSDILAEETDARSPGGALINIYTRESLLYKHVNRALRRDSPLLGPFGSYVAGLRDALHSLDPFCGRVYRNICGASATEYPCDLQFYWASFVSTSRQSDKAGAFGGLAFIIDVKASARGAHVRNMSAFPSEDEVLLPPYTRFRVISNDTKAVILETI